MNLRPKIKEAAPMVGVRVGQRWRDLYGPLAGRVMHVTSVKDGYTVLADPQFIHGFASRLSIQNLRKNWLLEDDHDPT